MLNFFSVLQGFYLMLMFKTMEIFHCIKELGTKRPFMIVVLPFLNTKFLLFIMKNKSSL